MYKATMKKSLYLFYVSIICSISVIGQNISVSDSLEKVNLEKIKKNINTKEDLRYNLNESGTHFIKFTMCNQTWVRFNENNPRSSINGVQSADVFDIGIRRTRFQLLGQITDQIFFYAQLGMNNFGFNSQRKFGFFIHDVVSEYAIDKEKLSIGGGLTGWTGPARFSSPSVSNFSGVDAPLFEQATNDINDQFLRKMSIYAKGKLGKFDYRIAFSKPFVINSGSNPNTGNGQTYNIPGGQAGIGSLGSQADNVSTWRTDDPNPQIHGYFQYQFFDKEANTTPYTQGTYLGKKKIFNIGAGFVYQRHALWARKSTQTVNVYDTTKYDYRTFAVDLFYDSYLNKEKGTAINIYAAYYNNYFGPNYIRNLGVFNPADNNAKPLNSNPNPSNYQAGGGNNFAIEGTGNILYGQIAYKFKDNLLGKLGTIMPYAGSQMAKYQRFKELMFYYDLGMSWLIKGHNAKITTAYQNRPIFGPNSNGDLVQLTRKGTFIVQMQIFF